MTLTNYCLLYCSQSKDYNHLNQWFNIFYIPYLNKKFSYTPLDPNDAFVPLDSSFDFSTIFALRYERVIKQDMFSLNNSFWSLIDENGELLHILKDTKVQIRIDVFTNEVYVFRYNKKYTCCVISDRKRKPQEVMNNQKDVQEFLNKSRNNI